MSSALPCQDSFDCPLWSDNSGCSSGYGSLPPQGRYSPHGSLRGPVPPPTIGARRPRRRADSCSSNPLPPFSSLSSPSNDNVIVENVDNEPYVGGRPRRWSVSGNHHRELRRFSSTRGTAAILFKDAKGVPVVQPLESSVASPEALESDIVNFFKCYKCYDLLPNSAKLVVLDTRLILKKAFFAMTDNGVRSCPLWDSDQQRYVGMLTTTDFIKILTAKHNRPDRLMEDFEEQRLTELRNIVGVTKELVYINPEASLFDAALLLVNKKLHRLPVLDPSNGNILYILTQKPILRFLFQHILDWDKRLYNSSHGPGVNTYLNDSIMDLKIGTYDNIEVATEETTIIAALHKFLNKKISALPIVDCSGVLIDIYSKFDVINLAAENTYSNLDISLKMANERRAVFFDGVHSCRGKESVFSVMDRIVKAEVQLLVVVDDEDKVEGIITVSDIISYIVQRHTEKSNQLRSKTKNIEVVNKMSSADDNHRPVHDNNDNT